MRGKPGKSILYITILPYAQFAILSDLWSNILKRIIVKWFLSFQNSEIIGKPADRCFIGWSNTTTNKTHKLLKKKENETAHFIGWSNSHFNDLHVKVSHNTNR